jgi:hypothetical protein
MPRLDAQVNKRKKYQAYDALLDLHTLDLSQVFGSLKRLNDIFEMENASTSFPIHPFFARGESSQKNPQLSSNEGAKFYSTFNLEFALVFRPDVLYLFIKDVYRSF